jgi:dimeric dUTPase (all-alpha-NTP-PPase superfamily)
MDKLEKIFEYQKKFDDEIIEKRNLKDIPMEEWIQKETLAMLSELAELLDEVNFKWWKNKKEVNVDLVRGELVDILHFFVSMCLKSGMDADMLFGRYMEKNKENFNRQNGLSEKKGYELK